MRRKRTAAVGTTIAALVCATPVQARNVRRWDHASSISRDVLVLAALGVPAIKQDWHGDLAAGGSMLAAAVVTGGLKEAFPETRPDGSNRKSFPSGHTSVAFAAAASLTARYGWRIGAPAQALAAFTGLARVEARKHHWYDVAVGAAIGEAGGFLITPRREARLTMMPWSDAKSLGAVISAQF